MKDRLEEFINQNRDQFDLYEPDNKLWSGIESNIRTDKKAGIGWKGVFWRAAVVLIIFAASFTLQEYRHLRKGRLSMQNEDLYRQIPELKEAEAYYTGLLNEKIGQIEPLLTSIPELGESLDQDLSELDSIYAELQRDLRDNIANDEIVEAMIQNYILKIGILEDLLDYMNESGKNNKDEKPEYEI